MSALRNIAVDWYRQVFGAPAGSDIREEGLDCVLDGNSAVALSEAAIATHAVFGGSRPATSAEEVWHAQFAHGSPNLFGEPLSAQTAEGPRGVVAAATGLALAGRRATAFLSGTDLGAVQDLLMSAAGKHVPLVLHVGSRAAATHGAALGSGHETVHLSADSGFFVLFAANVQEAVDFTFIARRVAEETLVPGLVVMDGEQTALATQDVRLLSPTQVSSFIGSAQDRIEAPTPAQQLLFGETRRRVPAWHDLDEPVLTGALYDKSSFAHGAFARRPFFDAFVAESLQSSFDRFAAKTGRQYEALSRYRTKDARLVLLAQGAAVETARAAADALRKQHKIKAGVLGVHALRPFPVNELATELDGRRTVIVLERTAAPLAGEPPLAREVRASLEQLEDKHRPALTPAVYGLGGLPLRIADLVELGSRKDLAPRNLVYLGLAFDDASGDQPKRDVLLDALRRAYPDLAQSAVQAPRGTAPATDAKSLAVAIRRGNTGDELLGTAAALLHTLEGGRVRSQPDVVWQNWSQPRVDWLVHGDASLHAPGSDIAADVTLDTTGATVSLGQSGEVFSFTRDDGEEHPMERLLGGLFGVLIHAGLLDQKSRSVVAARRRLLEETDPELRDALVSAFQEGLEELAEREDVAAEAATARWAGEAPASVRHLARDDDSFASLPRFWDQTGVLYRDGQADRLTADPFLATGTIPPLSSTFNDTSGARDVLPAFDPALCTGCGQCWTLCPDSAIGVVAATPAALIDAGIGLTGADAVRQVSSKLASRIIAANKKAEDAATTFGVMLDDAYAWLGDKMPLPEERKQAISDGIESIVNRLGALPVAVTKPFFTDAEATKKDSAELLSIVVNPEACKACGLCIEHCEPGALRAASQDAALLEQARTTWSVYADTPDTRSETLERIAQNPEIGEMAAILLSRYCQFALAGGDAAEAGSGEKIAARLALSATEYHQQPIAQRFAKSLGEAAESISGLIEQTLSSTLSIDDLDAITDKLKQTASPRVDLEQLAQGIGGEDDHSIDTDYLLRLIDLYNRIEVARQRVVEGEHGLGRARYGLAVAGGSAAEWAGTFPNNPFQAPVVIDMTGNSAQLAAGLVEGHLEETAALVRLLRQAQIEIEQPDGADWKREALTILHWQDLSPDEVALCPPLVLIGSDEMLAGQGLGQLIWLLNSGMPVKVLVLSSLDVAEQDACSNNPRASLGMLALAQRNAYVAQTSIADSAHLGESMLQALTFNGPALLQVYAPSPSRHGFPASESAEQARLAFTSRALPLFRYDPRADGVFGSRISLDGNPAPAEALPDSTLADWALGQQRFAAHFEPLPNTATAAVAMADWLQLDPQARAGKTPYVIAPGTEDVRLSVSPSLADAASERFASWRTLQELAGIVTPFTERLEQDIRAQLAAEHEADLDAQRQASAAELREIEEKTQAEIARNIRSRLLQLATRKRN